MKCPKCQMEINSNSKFCTKCGCNLAAEAAKAAKPPEPAPQVKCVKCGAALMPGAKFCTKCGTPNDPSAAREDDNRTMFLYEDDSKDDGRTMLITHTDIPQENVPRQAPVQAPQQAPVQMPQQAPRAQQDPMTMTMPISNDIASPMQREPRTMAMTMPMEETAQPSGNGGKSKGRKSGWIIAILIVTLLIAASGAIYIIVANGDESGDGNKNPIVSAFNSIFGGSDDEEQTTEESSEETTSEEVTEEEGALPPELSQRFDEADALLAEGKEKAKLDTELGSGMTSLRDAIDKFAGIGQEAGDTSLVAEKIADGYAAYVTALLKHKEIMAGQEVSGSVYSQIMTEMNDTEKLANELSEKGYTVDISTLTSAKDEFKKSYTERVIKKFDEFTTRDAWSRTESWNLMSGFGGMFDSDNLDDPIRLRYAYALSWWIQKQIETELASGTITEKGAAIKIANEIDSMDYNPMMIDYYITYMKKSNENCADVAAAYKEVMDKINSQGIKVGTEIPLNKFWYYNDFGAYSVDAKNGVTPENRAWIRDRMKNVQFVKK